MAYNPLSVFLKADGDLENAYIYGGGTYLVYRGVSEVAYDKFVALLKAEALSEEDGKYTFNGGHFVRLSYAANGKLVVAIDADRMFDAAYLAFDVPVEKTEKAVEALRTLHAGGFNVTMPCKTAVAQLVDKLSPAAELVGACNTVVFEEYIVGK